MKQFGIAHTYLIQNKNAYRVNRDKTVEFTGKTEKTDEMHKNLRNICKITFPHIGKIPCDVFYNLIR